MSLDYDKITDIVFAGIDHSDYPDYVDAYIESAKYNGEEMTEEQLNNLDSEWINEQLFNYLY
jgi:hypothetical protein